MDPPNNLDSPPVSLRESRWKTGGYAFGCAFGCAFVAFSVLRFPLAETAWRLAGWGLVLVLGLSALASLLHVFNPGVLTIDQDGFQFTFSALKGARTERHSWAEVARFGLVAVPSKGGGVSSTKYNVVWWRAQAHERLQRTFDASSPNFVKLKGEWPMSDQSLADLLNEAHMRWAKPETP